MKKNILLGFSIVLLTLSFFMESSAQNTTPAIEWQKTLGGSSTDVARSIQQTTDGGYIVAGGTRSSNGDVTVSQGDNDFWVVKLDASGNLVWQKTFGGSSTEEANSIQQTTDGGYIVAGQTQSNNGDVIGFQGNTDFWVVKLDATGNLIWQKTLGGSGTDVARSIQQTTDGGYIIAGSTSFNDGDVTGHQGSYDFWVVKLDASGNLIWQKTLGGSGTDYANSIQQTTDGGYIVAGYTTSNNGDVTGNQGNDDFWVVKLDVTGNLVWQKTLGGSNLDLAYSIQQTTDGGYIVAGRTQSNNGDVTGNQGNNDFWVVKLDASGNLVWQKTLGGSGDDWAYSVKQTTDGGYIVAGYTTSNDGDVTGYQGDVDFWVVKLDATGNLIWQKTLGGSNTDYANSIQQTMDGGYILAGSTQSNDGDVTGNQGLFDFWVVKLRVASLNIVGNVYTEDIINCSFDAAEAALPNFLVRQTSTVIRTVSTDTSGVFTIPVFDTATYEFEAIIPQHLEVFYTNNCAQNYSVLIDSLGADTSGFDFGFEVEPCPLLLVDVGSNRRRPCFTTTNAISYRNDGVVAATNVEIILELPDSVYPISASQPYIVNALGQLVFSVGTLAAGESGTISVRDSMACELSLSNTQACTYAWISPANTCYNNLVNPTPWDSSNIVINGGLQLDSLGDTCYVFALHNEGAAMQDSLSFSVYSATGFVQSNPFLLGANDSIVVEVCGTNYAQIVVNQHQNNPLQKIAFFAPPTQDSTVVNIYEFINVDENLESAVECITVVNAYDPNDKNATPSGWGAANYVSPSTLLDYKIRFQNTGNDTAYNVLVIDTIDATVFDVSKLILGASSFPYRFEVSGEGNQVVFHFYFDGINLLDSTNHEPESHGFVNFKIGAYDNIAQGTVANNFVDIYFDFNPPIRTNTSMLTLQDIFPQNTTSGVTVKIVEEQDDEVSIRDVNKYNVAWNIHPNPTNSSLQIAVYSLDEAYTIAVQNVLGQQVYSQTTEEEQMQINTTKWESGMYFITLKSKQGNIMAVKQLVKE